MDVALREIRAAANALTFYRDCLNTELARAYEANGQQDSVIAVLERYHTSLPAAVAAYRLSFAAWIWYPVVQLWLAGIYESRHDYTNAAGHCRTFIDLWERADPEWQPYVAQAREALARIRANGA